MSQFIEHMPSILKALGSIPSTENKEINKESINNFFFKKYHLLDKVGNIICIGLTSSYVHQM